ncbi:MAG: formyltransferase family protein [Myxococcota bacterium]
MRPKPLFLFCDPRLATELLECAAVFSRRYGLEVTVCLSTRSAAKSRRWRTAVRPWLRTALGYSFRVKRIDDVNREWFLASVPEGAHGIVHFWNQIFHAQAIRRFSSLVNLHESLLPFYRGPTPLYWIIANRERIGGSTLHRVTSTIDGGEILYQEAWPMRGRFSPRSLHDGNRPGIRRAFVSWLEHLYERRPYVSRTVDAAACYRQHEDYLGRPPKRGIKTSSAL